MNKLTLSTDYKRIFDNRMIIITGISRSGTSILGRIVGSLENVIYLYEPVIMRLLPTLVCDGHINYELATQLLKGILFEDFYLQLLHGRNLNFKKSDNSFIGNYQDLKTVRQRWLKYKRRNDILNDIYNGKYTFLLKINEIHPLLPILEKIFAGIKIIHLIRNGNNVISSSLKRGWYSDEYLNRHMIQWMYQRQIKVPWFVPAKDAEKFCKWNGETRIAYIWRNLIKTAMDYSMDKDNYLELRYENLVNNPEGVANLCEKFVGAQKTKLTLKNILAIKSHNLTKHPDQTDKINREEYPLFKNFMEKLNYYCPSEYSQRINLNNVNKGVIL